MEASGNIGDLSRCRWFHPHGFREFEIVAAMVETLTVRSSLKMPLVFYHIPFLGYIFLKKEGVSLRLGSP